MNETNKIIPPTVGRQVHFHLASADVPHMEGWSYAWNNTYAATVAFVHSDRLVNLSVIDAGGFTYGMESIPLCQPDGERPLGNWCEWPPHTAAMSRPLGRVPTLQSAGEPPTLNTPASRAEKLTDAIAMNQYAGDPREAAAIMAGQGAPSAETHPAIAGTQRLDNDGNPLVSEQQASIYQDHHHQARKRHEDELRAALPPPTIPQD